MLTNSAIYSLELRLDSIGLKLQALSYFPRYRKGKIMKNWIDTLAASPVRRITAAMALTFLAACMDSPLATVQPEADDLSSSLDGYNDLSGGCPGSANIDTYSFIPPQAAVWMGADSPLDSVARLDVQASQTTPGPSKHVIRLGFKVGLGIPGSVGPQYWVDEYRTSAREESDCMTDFRADFTLEIPHVKATGGELPEDVESWIVYPFAFAEGTATADGRSAGSWHDIEMVDPFRANIPKMWTALCARPGDICY